MADNNRDQNSDQRNTPAQDNNADAQKGNASTQRGQDQNQDENPQEGSQWSNYQTRELSSDQGGGEGNATVPHNKE